LALASRPAAGLPSVVHLVRRGTPLAVLERFLESYRRNEAGVEHRFVLLCKGFESADELAPVLERLDGLRAERIDVPDDGYDLTAYRRAAERLDGVACYLNSNSVLLCPGWLEQLVAALVPGVGIAGATGSWNSAHSNARYLLRVPGAYTAVFPDRAWHRAQSRRLPRDDAATSAFASALARPPLRYLRTSYSLGRSLAMFREFPAAHVRTNAFAIRSETMRRLRMPRLRNKTRAWQLESGRGSITEQIRSGGLEALIVGRGGSRYHPPEWADSDTLWQADQGELLVADNQTERYRLGDLDLRTLLSKVAWGSKARPRTPS
jgi:hypothetical protein